MFTQLLFFAVLCISTRAFTLQQEASLQRRCVDLQCPRSAFETGTQRLLVDEAGAQEDCKTCQDCTATGYSVCMQMLGPQNHRAKRQTTACSCAHAVPDSCLVKPAHGRVLNGSFVTHNVCYLNSLQTPPKPLATNEKFAVLVDVEVFWQEPYWLDFHVSNLKLHYEFKAGVPEHCEGNVRTVDGPEPEHFCHGIIDLDRPPSAGDSDEPAAAKLFEEPEYDDERPEIQFDRDVFHNASEAKFWITVEVKRPRQLQFNSRETSPFVDVTTELPSDELVFDITWDKHDEGSYPEYPDHNGGHVYGDDIVIKSNEIVKTPIVSKEKSEEVEDKVQDDVDKLTTTTEEPENETTPTFDDSHDVNDDKSDDIDDEPVDKDEDEVTDAPEEDEPKESEEDEVTTEAPEDDDDKDDQDGKDDNVVKSEQEDDAIIEPEATCGGVFYEPGLLFEEGGRRRP